MFTFKIRLISKCKGIAPSILQLTYLGPKTQVTNYVTHYDYITLFIGRTYVQFCLQLSNIGV
jgi:hypothetical protein